MSPTTKQTAIVVGGLGVAVIGYLYLRGKKQPTVEVLEPIGYEEPYTVPEYLNYNIGGLGQGTGGSERPPPSFIFGDINVGTGGSSSPFQACKQGGFMPMPSTTSGSSNLDLVIPAIVAPPTSKPPPSITPYVIEPYNKYKCDVQQIKKDLDTISGLIGVPLDEIMKENLSGGQTSSGNVNAAKMEPDLVIRNNAGNAIGYQWYYDPVADHSVKGKRVRYKLEWACECKKGNTDYCGQYLSPTLFESAYGLEGN